MKKMLPPLLISHYARQNIVWHVLCTYSLISSTLRMFLWQMKANRTKQANNAFITTPYVYQLWPTINCAAGRSENCVMEVSGQDGLSYRFTVITFIIQTSTWLDQRNEISWLVCHLPHSFVSYGWPINFVLFIYPSGTVCIIGAQTYCAHTRKLGCSAFLEEEMSLFLKL